MLEEEILVAPLLVRGIARVAAEGVAQIARGAMPVAHVVVERIERGQVEAAAEPPGHGLAVADRAEMADVGVRGRQVRVARVEHQRHAHRTPRCAGQLGPRGGRRRRQLRAGDIGEPDPRLLEDRAIAQDPRAPAAAFGAFPEIFLEGRGAVGALDGGADAVLQTGEVVADAEEIGVGICHRTSLVFRNCRAERSSAAPSPEAALRQNTVIPNPRLHRGEGSAVRFGRPTESRQQVPRLRLGMAMLGYRSAGVPQAAELCSALRFRDHAGCRLAYAITSHLLPSSSKLTCTRACAPVPSISVTMPLPNFAWVTFWPTRTPVFSCSDA